MANEKNTDSGPDEGLTESGSATPETNGRESNGHRGEYDELDALDEREGEFDDVIDDDGDDDDYDGDDYDDDDDSDRERELVSVGAATTSRTASEGSSAATSTATTTETTETTRRGRKKGRATPKQRARAEKESKGGPVNFVRGSVSELQKVVYPTWPQLVNYFVVVLVFVLVIIGVVAGLDYGIGWVMLRLFS